MLANTQSKPRVAIYMRVANDNHSNSGLTALYCRLAQADTERIGEQEIKLHVYAKDKHYGFCAVYRDNGESGATLDRPGLRALLDNVCSGNVKRVIVADLSRLARNFIHAHELMELFSQYGVEFISVNDGGVINIAEQNQFRDELIRYARHHRGKNETEPATAVHIQT